MANMKLFGLTEDASTAADEFMTKFGLNDEFNRIFTTDEVKAMIQAGFEKTKGDIENAINDNPEEVRELLRNLAAENQLFDHEAFTENLRFYMRYTLMKSMKKANQLMGLMGAEITDDFMKENASDALSFIMVRKAFECKIDVLHDMYLDLMVKEIMERFDVDPEQEEPQETDEEEIKNPGSIGELFDLLQRAGVIEVHVIPICLGRDDGGEDSEEDSEE